MSAAARVIPSDLALETATMLRELLVKRADEGLGDEFFARDRTELWDELDTGGWIDVATEFRAADPDSWMVDLAAVMEVWGETLLPFPFAEACLTRIGLTGPIGLGTATETYLAHPDGWRGDRQLPATAPTLVDRFAPSLPVGEFVGTTDLAVPASVRRPVAVLWTASAVGCATAALQMAVAYSAERQAYGKAIGTFQAVQHLAADMHRDTELARTAVAWAAAEPEHAQFPVVLSAALGRCLTVVNGAVQILGGIGFTWEAGLHFHLRHVVTVAEHVRRSAFADG